VQAQTDKVDAARQKMFAAMDKANDEIPAAVERLELATSAQTKTAAETGRSARVSSGQMRAVRPPAKALAKPAKG
jgi:hypothetical protein